MDFEKLLLDYGLDEKESKAYLANLELGPAKVSEIATKSGLGRVHTYNILDSLIKKGLASKTYRQEKIYFMARNPEILARIIKERADKFKKILPELKALARSEKMPAIRFFEGNEGLKSIYEDSLTSKSEIFSWGNVVHLEEFLPEYFHQYYKRRAKKKIFIRSIIADTEFGRQYQKQDNVLFREIRLVPEQQMNIVPECYIYEDKVAYMSLREKIGIIIKSKDIAEAQRQLFLLAWEQAGRHHRSRKSDHEKQKYC